MTESILPADPFQLDLLRVTHAYFDRVVNDPEGANESVREVLGLDHSPSSDLVLIAFQKILCSQFREAGQILLDLGISQPAMIGAIYKLLALVFKYLIAGAPISDLAAFGMNHAVSFYYMHPKSLEAQFAILDMLLYFGRAESLGKMIGQVDQERFIEEIAEYQAYLQRQNSYEDRHEVSFVMLAGTDPALLRHTLSVLSHSAWSQSSEVVLGLSEESLEMRLVASEFGVRKIHSGTPGWGLNQYADIYGMADGKYVIQISNAIESLPLHFDRTLMDALDNDEALGLVGHWPERVHLLKSGTMKPALERMHNEQPRSDKPFGLGPVSGACSAIRRKDFLAINGFARATLSPMSREEIQLIRKLSVYGKVSGVFFDQGLVLRSADE